MVTIEHPCTAAFTYYYDPAILLNKWTPLLIFKDLSLRKRNSKELIVYLYVFYRMYTNIPKMIWVGSLFFLWIV